MSTRGGNHQGRGGFTAAWLALALSPVWGSVWGCSATSTPEEGLVREGRFLEDTCEVRPRIPGPLEPELQWAWTGSEVLPEHHQVMMMPVVVDVNRDGIADLVFTTFAASTYQTDGVLRAVSGDDGRELWTATAPETRLKPSASLTAGDIDGDGQVEICGIPQDGRGILCVEHDGAFKFRSAPAAYDYNEWGGPSLADLDGDGQVEILDGNRVYSATGALKWVGADGMGGAQYTGPVSFAADLDQDGKQELINDRAVYRHDGTPLCIQKEIPHGFAGVANFDEDPAGEIVVVGHGQVSLLDSDCSVLWSVEVPGGGHGGPPNLADFDGDGQVEVGLLGEHLYSVLEGDGTVKWSLPMQDLSSGKVGSTTFDFEDDGKLEVIFADELALRILDGATGRLLWTTPNSSGTTHETPLIANVDGDPDAELVVVSNDHAYPGTHGVRVFRGKHGWAATRNLWNQHAYSVTNVNDDGSIPAAPRAHWLDAARNTFHANGAYDFGQAPSPYAAPDLVVTSLSAACDGQGHTVLTAYVRNQGKAPVAGGSTVAFFSGSPFVGLGATRLGTALVTEALPAGGSGSATLMVPSGLAGRVSLFATVDAEGGGTGRDLECREDNNTTSTTAELACDVPPANQPPVALCRDVSVPADAQCRGRASVDRGSYDPDRGPSALAVTESSPDSTNASFGPGRHAVTLTASDGEASAQCVGSVTVVDSVPPTITCPLSLDVKIRLGEVGLALQYATSSQDNCGPAPVTCTHPPGTIFLPGLTRVTCTARDTSGNTASCEFGIRVSVSLSL